MAPRGPTKGGTVKQLSLDNAIALQMGRSEAQVYGYLDLPCRVEVNARIRTERQLENHNG